jgi:CBS-domain-containing membrane protein
MVRRPSLPTNALRSRRDARTQRLLANRAVADTLLSVAGVVGRPVRITGGAEVGRLVDMVARWEGDSYPPVTGLVVRVGRRLAFVPIEHVVDLSSEGIALSSARFDLRDFERRPGEVLLNGDVVDHQLVDVDGIRVVRASDLYFTRVGGRVRLVGVDVSFRSLVRRLGPSRWRNRAKAEGVIDWAAIQPFGTGNGPVRLRRTNQELSRLHPSELADLLEELGRPERQELLDALEPESAADALEEMEPDKLDALLRELPPERAAELLTEMEPDEAVDALRLLDDEERDARLAVMAPAAAAHLRRLLRFPALTAGGVMTTRVVTARPGETVRQVRDRLRDLEEHRSDIDCVVIVDDDGRLVDDISLYELFTAELDQSVSELAAPPWPFTVSGEAQLDDVVERVIDTRGSSVIVVDDDGRPLGRILVDDVVDALVTDGGRTHRRRRS